MKQLYTILTFFAMTACSLTAFAQGGQQYDAAGGVSTAKRVTGPANGVYTITLETFATGEQTVVQRSIPSDIILLLDYSSSMLTGDNITTLKRAVVDFVKEMQENNDELVLQDGQMGNRIAFVLYAGLLYDNYPSTTQHVNGRNNLPLLNDYPYFNAQYVNQFLEVTDLTANGANVSYNNVNILSPSSQHNAHPSYLGGSNFGDTNKGTNTPAAMAKALELVNANTSAYSDDERSTTVILFTDGEPCDIYQQYYQGDNNAGSSGFSTAYANSCISDAKSIKDKGVSIYTVGLFSSPTRQIKTFVEYTSSDFPSATAMPARERDYLQSNQSYGDFCTIVSGGLDLSGVFRTISQGVGGENANLGTNTEVRDVVSSSFDIPNGTSAADIRVYTSAISADGGSWGDLQRIYTTPAEQAQYITVSGSRVSVTGFNYGGTDNWVGKRLKANGNPDNPNDWQWKGKKVVIQFDIRADDMATGGDGTATNTTDSGVYVNGECINHFNVPHTNLPVNLEIVKSGLHHGESATFVVWRCHPLKVNNEVQYNAIGKPKPDGNWVEHARVIVSNYQEWGDDAVKILRGLDPTYVYMITESNWSWSYTLTNATAELEMMTTAETERNPFKFRNQDKAGVAKHGEAVVSNHFGTGHHVQKAKSDKKAK